jgi:hypothetical protein
MRAARRRPAGGEAVTLAKTRPIIKAPAEIPECITWRILRGRVLRDYALSLLHWLAPQLDRRDLRRVLKATRIQLAAAAGLGELTQSIAV